MSVPHPHPPMVKGGICYGVAWPWCRGYGGKEDTDHVDMALMGGYFYLNKNVYFLHSVRINRAGAFGSQFTSLISCICDDLSCF